jgi:hypothetical protein
LKTLAYSASSEKSFSVGVAWRTGAGLGLPGVSNWFTGKETDWRFLTIKDFLEPGFVFVARLDIDCCVLSRRLALRSSIDGPAAMTVVAVDISGDKWTGRLAGVGCKLAFAIESLVRSANDKVWSGIGVMLEFIIEETISFASRWIFSCLASGVLKLSSDIGVLAPLEVELSRPLDARSCEYELTSRRVVPPLDKLTGFAGEKIRLSGTAVELIDIRREFELRFGLELTMLLVSVSVDDRDTVYLWGGALLVANGL